MKVGWTAQLKLSGPAPSFVINRGGLEENLHGHLDVAIIVRASESPACRSVEKIVGTGSNEIGMIEQIEGLKAKLQFRTFGETEVFMQTEVKILEAWPSDNIGGSISLDVNRSGHTICVYDCSGRVVGETSGIVPAVGRPFTCREITIANPVWNINRWVTDRKWPAILKREDIIHPPPSE